jgi:hypothetical protein
MAGIGSKIKDAAMKAAKEKVSGGKKGKKRNGGSGSGADKAKRALKNFLK